MTYEQFIDNILTSRGRFGISEEEYKERHHIIPKCLGGKDEESNLIDLYAREHFEAHRLLALENSENAGLQCAWHMMCKCNTSKFNKRYMSTPEEYEELKNTFSNAMSMLMSGRKFTQAHKDKISNAKKGKAMSEEAKERMRKNHADFSNGKHPMCGKHHSQEAIQHMKDGQSHRDEQWRKKQHDARVGRKLTKEWKEKIGNSMRGKKHPIKKKGYVPQNAKKVFCDGIVFDSLTECVKHYGLKSVGNFSCFLNGTKKMPKKWKKLGLRWYEDGTF